MKFEKISLLMFYKSCISVAGCAVGYCTVLHGRRYCSLPVDLICWPWTTDFLCFLE